MKTVFTIVLLFMMSVAWTQEFPSLSLTTLNDEDLQLPDDFSSRYTLIFLPLEQEQQDDFTTWEAYVLGEVEARANLDFMQILLIGDMNFLLKGIISNAMKAAYVDAVQARTAAVFEKIDPWLEALAVEDTSEMHILLVRDKDVIWRAQGAFSEGLASEIAALITPTRPDN